MILAIIGFLLVLDQFTKSLILKKLTWGQSLPVITNIFHLTLVSNKGSAFGILRGTSAIFIIISFLLIIFIILSLKKRSGYFSLKSVRFAFALILSGALGNLIDRIRFGYVVDFLDFRIWPVFNIADSTITIGAILLGIQLLKKSHP